MKLDHSQNFSALTSEEMMSTDGGLAVIAAVLIGSVVVYAGAWTTAYIAVSVEKAQAQNRLREAEANYAMTVAGLR
jgi:lactobin A/cerein 7B family class IIb bacteriocin